MMRGKCKLVFRVWGVLLLAALSFGCAQKAGVIFPPAQQTLGWPNEPEPQRVRWVGQLQTSEDLKPAVSWTQAMGRALFGKKAARSMLSPYALCTDGQDRLFVADSNGQTVHVFDLKTRKYDQWRPNNAEKRFAQPVGIAWDPSGRLFVSDSVAGVIYAFDSIGNTVELIADQVMGRPCGLAYDATRQRLIVADVGLHQVLIFSRDGSLLERIGSRGTALGEFNYPTNVAVDHAGRIYVSDSLNFRIQQFAPDLQPLLAFGRKGDTPGCFMAPKGVAVDSDGHLYVVDAGFESVQVFDQSGQLLLNIGEEGRKPGEFWLPAGIFIDPRDRIWIADTYNRRVQVMDYLRQMEGKP